MYVCTCMYVLYVHTVSIGLILCVYVNYLYVRTWNRSLKELYFQVLELYNIDLPILLNRLMSASHALINVCAVDWMMAP